MKSEIKIGSMIKMIIGTLKCKKNGHILDEQVSCPFTGKSYRGCKRCGITITV